MNVDTSKLRETLGGNSFYSVYRQCPRKFFFRYVLGYRPLPDHSPTALALGSAGHEALYMWWKEGNKETALEHGMDVLEALNVQNKDKEPCKERLAAGFLGAIAELEELLGEGWEVVEYEKTHVCAEYDIEIAYKPDVILKKDSEYLIVDYKWTSRTPNEYDAGVRNSEQPYLYMWQYGLENNIKSVNIFWRTLVIQTKYYKTKPVLVDVELMPEILQDESRVMEYEGKLALDTSGDIIRSMSSLEDLFKSVYEGVKLFENTPRQGPYLFPRNVSRDCNTCPFVGYCSSLTYRVSEIGANAYKLPFELDEWKLKGYTDYYFQNGKLPEQYIKEDEQ